MSRIIVDRRLWLDADGDLVEDGDPSSAFLWASEGREVSEEEAERLGYQPADEPEPDDSDGSPSDEPEAADEDEMDAAEDEPDLCAGTTAAGKPCSNKAGDDGFCHLHGE